MMLEILLLYLFIIILFLKIYLKIILFFIAVNLLLCLIYKFNFIIGVCIGNNSYM
jgi:hypothetical protein